MLRNYLQLRARVDRFVDSVVARYSDQITCRPACPDCCAPGLTVVMVEAIALGAGLGIDRDRIYLQAGQPPLSEEGRCALLDGGGNCTAYDERPITCRIQGLPIRVPGSDGYSVCPSNFVGAAAHPSAVFDLEKLETALFAVNLDYCQRSGLRPLSRVALDRIASLVATAKAPAP